jgi:hypothetical protein
MEVDHHLELPHHHHHHHHHPRLSSSAPQDLPQVLLQVQALELVLVVHLLAPGAAPVVATPEAPQSERGVECDLMWTCGQSCGSEPSIEF